MIEQFGFDYDLNDAQLKLINQLQQTNRSYKFFPIAAIAFDLKVSQKDYQIYSFLPLQQRSPIDCHVNGFWALQYDNRKSLFNSETKDHICTKWNQILIYHIVLPLYLKSLNKRIESFNNKFKSKDIEDFSSYLDYFPHEIKTDHSIKVYFEAFNKSFYQRISDIESVPILDPNTKQVKWQKPNQLIFSKPLVDFLNVLKTCQNIHEICQEILQKIQIKICEYNQLLARFSSIGNINLNEITTETIIQAFKNGSNRLVGLRIEDSIFKCPQNLKLLLRFCTKELRKKKQIEKEFEGCPMLLNENNVIVKFSLREPIFTLEKNDGILEFFTNAKNRFLNREFYLREFLGNSNYTSFIKEFSINEIEIFCQELVPELKINQDIVKVKSLLEKNPTILRKLNLIWKIITKTLSSRILDLRERQTTVHELLVIKEYALVPVCVGDPDNEYLLKVSKLNQAIVKVDENSPLSKVIVNLRIPYFDPGKEKVRKYNFVIELTKLKEDEIRNEIDLISNLLTNEKSSHDVLNLLQTYSELKISKEDAQSIRFYLNNKIQITNQGQFAMGDPKSNYSIDRDKLQRSFKECLKTLTIFEDLNDQIFSIDSKNVLLMKIDEADIKSFPKCGLGEFFSSKELNVLRKDEALFNLHNFLEFKEIGFEQFYLDFFEFHLKLDPRENHQVFVAHMKFIQNLFSLGKIRKLKENDQLWVLLGAVPFIKIEESFYPCKKLYDPSNILFKAIFQDLLLPKSYLTNEWQHFVRDVGFKTSIDEDDFVKMAFKLEAIFEEDRLKMEDSLVLAQKLLSSVNRTTLIEKIGDAKFIPNYYQVERIKNVSENKVNKSFRENLIEKSFNSTKSDHHKNTKFVSLNDSAPSSAEMFCWLLNPVLPEIFDKYCERKTVEPERFVENFLKILELLTDEFVIDSDEEKSEITDLFNSYYRCFFSFLEDQNLLKNLEKLRHKKFVLNPSKSGSKFLLNFPQNVYRNVDHLETIEGFVLNTYCFDSYWKLFSYLGANDKMTFENSCLVLNSIIREDEFLSDSRFDDVLIIYKFLLINGILTAECPETILLVPNLLKTMKPLKDLFFVDDPNFQSLIESEMSIKEFIVFDLNELLKILNRNEKSDEENDFNLKNTKMFGEFRTWKQIISQSSYFKKYPNMAPKPLSEIICYKLAAENIVHEKDFEIISRFHSEKFTQGVIKCIEMKSSIFTDELKQFVCDLIKRTNVYSTDSKIQGFYFNILTGKRLELKDKLRDKLFFTTTEFGNTLKIIYSKNEVDKSLLSFWLAEVVLNEIKKVFLKLAESFNENLFVFLLSKLFEDESNDLVSFKNYIIKIQFNLN